MPIIHVNGDNLVALCHPKHMENCIMSIVLYRLTALWPPLTLGTLAVAMAALSPDIFALPAALFGAVMVLDARARAIEFDRAVLNMCEAGHAMDLQARMALLLARHRRSWCQREMIKAASAAVVEGGRDTASAAFRCAGYRWFHVFPDGTFTRDCPFFKASFWKTLVGIGTPKNLR